MEESIVDLAGGEDVDALTMKGILGPGSEVDVGGGVEEDALAVPFAVDDLADVVAVVGVGDFDMVLEVADASDVVCLFVFVFGDDFGGVVLLHFNNF